MRFFVSHSKCKDSTISSNPIDLKKYKAMTSTIVVALKKCEQDFELQNILVENEHEIVQEGQKKHDLALTQLESLTTKVKLLDHEGSHNKI